MSRHKIQSYWDGHIEIEFCAYCGLEGLELRETYPCQPIEDSNQLSFDLLQKDVDSKSEQT